MKIPLTIDKNIQSNLAVKVIVGARGNNLCHVFESTQKLPKFSMFVEAQSNAHLNIPSYVAFSVGDKLHKVAQWMVDSFIVEQPPQSAVFEATFLSLRDGKPLVIETKNNGEILVRVDDMEVAGDIVQDICATLLIEDMESVAHFPEEMKKFEESLTNVSEYNVTRSRLTAEMADNSNLIKTLVIKAEDARLLGEM